MGWGVGMRCPLPTEEGVWGGVCAPSREMFLIFLVQCVQKIFVVRQNGGGIAQCPPKYATGQKDIQYKTAKPKPILQRIRKYFL